jgi:hypothetical protein
MVENSESNLSGIHRTYEHKSPQVLPNAEAALWTGPAAINVHFHVWFYLAEQEGAAQSVTLGQRLWLVGSIGCISMSFRLMEYLIGPGLFC